jgi:UPF0755 protein
MKKAINKILLYVLLLSCTVVVIFGAWLFIYASAPINSGKAATVLVDIPTETSFIKATEILDRAGLVDNKPLFYSLAVVKKATRVIRAGEYEFATSLSPSELIDKLIRGDVKKYAVIIYEDDSLKKVAARLKESKLIDEKIFFELAGDRAFLSSMGIGGPSIEGYLFPDTYFLNRSMTTKQIMKMMVNGFWMKISPEMIKQAAKKGLTLHQFVTFASLIGKESGYSAEKPMIAAVFYNRLKRGMPLQSDPTAVYDLRNFNGKVLRSHYRRESPYNTYLIRGLPPGPIGNPGLDSFRAVLNPAAVNYLYFVARGDGTHFFSSSFNEHVAAIMSIRSNVSSTSPGHDSANDIAEDGTGDSSTARE